MSNVPIPTSSVSPMYLSSLDYRNSPTATHDDDQRTSQNPFQSPIQGNPSSTTTALQVTTTSVAPNYVLNPQGQVDRPFHISSSPRSPISESASAFGDGKNVSTKNASLSSTGRPRLHRGETKGRALGSLTNIDARARSFFDKAVFEGDTPKPHRFPMTTNAFAIPNQPTEIPRQSAMSALSSNPRQPGSHASMISFRAPSSHAVPSERSGVPPQKSKTKRRSGAKKKDQKPTTTLRDKVIEGWLWKNRRPIDANDPPILLVSAKKLILNKSHEMVKLKVGVNGHEVVQNDWYYNQVVQESVHQAGRSEPPVMLVLKSKFLLLDFSQSSIFSVDILCNGTLRDTKSAASGYVYLSNVIRPENLMVNDSTTRVNVAFDEKVLLTQKNRPAGEIHLHLVVSYPYERVPKVLTQRVREMNECNTQMAIAASTVLAQESRENPEENGFFRVDETNNFPARSDMTLSINHIQPLLSRHSHLAIQGAFDWNEASPSLVPGLPTLPDDAHFSVMSDGPSRPAQPSPSSPLDPVHSAFTEELVPPPYVMVPIRSPVLKDSSPVASSPVTPSVRSGLSYNPFDQDVNESAVVSNGHAWSPGNATNIPRPQFPSEPLVDTPYLTVHEPMYNGSDVPMDVSFVDHGVTKTVQSPVQIDSSPTSLIVTNHSDPAHAGHFTSEPQYVTQSDAEASGAIAVSDRSPLRSPSRGLATSSTTHHQVVPRPSTISAQPGLNISPNEASESNDGDVINVPNLETSGVPHHCDDEGTTALATTKDDSIVEPTTAIEYDVNDSFRDPQGCMYDLHHRGAHHHLIKTISIRRYRLTHLKTDDKRRTNGPHVAYESEKLDLEKNQGENMENDDIWEQHQTLSGRYFFVNVARPYQVRPIWAEETTMTTPIQHHATEAVVQTTRVARPRPLTKKSNATVLPFSESSKSFDDARSEASPPARNQSEITSTQPEHLSTSDDRNNIEVGQNDSNHKSHRSNECQQPNDRHEESVQEASLSSIRSEPLLEPNAQSPNSADGSSNVPQQSMSFGAIGEDDPFRHDTNEPLPGPDPSDLRTFSSQSLLRPADEATLRHNTLSSVCQFYRPEDPQSCIFASNCRFRHPEL